MPDSDTAGRVVDGKEREVAAEPQRHRVHRGHRLDSGQRSDASDELRLERGRLRHANARLIARDRKEQHIRGRESRRHGRCVQRAPDEESARDQQHERQRHLRSEHGAAQIETGREAAAGIRQQTHGDRRDRREAQRKGEDANVQPEIERQDWRSRLSHERRRLERDDQVEQPRSEKQSGDRRDERQQRRLDQPEAHQPAAAGTERGAKRHLALARGGTRDQETCHVHAGQCEHDQADAKCGAADRQRFKSRRGRPLADRSDLRLLVGRRLMGSIRGCERGASLLERDAVVQSRDRREPVLVAGEARWLSDQVRPRREGNPQIDRHLWVKARESSPAHAGDGERSAVENDVAPDDGRIGRKPPLPEAVAQDGRRRRIDRPVRVAIERATQLKTDVRDRKERRRDGFGIDGLTPVAVAQEHRPCAGERHRLGEQIPAGARLQIRRKRRAPIGGLRRRVIDGNGSLEIAHGRRPQEQRVHCAEHRGVDAQSERQRQHGGRDKPRLPRQHPKALTNLQQKRFHGPHGITRGPGARLSAWRRAATGAASR